MQFHSKQPTHFQRPRRRQHASSVQKFLFHTGKIARRPFPCSAKIGFFFIYLQVPHTADFPARINFQLIALFQAAVYHSPGHDRAEPVFGKHPIYKQPESPRSERRSVFSCDLHRGPRDRLDQSFDTLPGHCRHS